MKNTYYKKTIQEVAKEFNVDLAQGLPNKEADRRLKKYGFNTLKTEKAVSSFELFFRQFSNPLMFILMLAAGASLILGDFNDAIVIAFAGLINVLLGFFQEWKAEKAAAALRSYEVFYSIVLRDGKEKQIETKKLVPGDIVFLNAGSKIPADIRLSQAIDFQVDEALLTGESEAIIKITEPLADSLTIGDRKNIAFLGAFALRGKARGIVVRTGEQTYLGDIAYLATQVKGELTPIQRQIKRVSWFLAALMLAVVAVVFLVGLIKNLYQGFNVHDLKELISISIALAVAAIPEGLLIGITVVLAIGMQKMLKQKALIRKLVATEGLGSVSVICTDKTGTLTQGYLSTVRLVTPKYDLDLKQQKPDEAREILVMAVLNNDAVITKESRIGSPTELALFELAQNIDIDIRKERKKYPRIAEIPFSSDIKYMATVHPMDGYERLIVKGAPEVILQMSSLPEEQQEKIKKAEEEMAAKGLRVLALAYRDKKSIDLKKDVGDLVYAGLFGLQDALRETTVDTIKKLNKAGIRVVLVTGDHLATALHIARQAGIKVHKDGAITGVELDTITDEELGNRIKDISVFARIDPRHKIRIVKAWQSHKKFVAMVGDGVNDAPAIRAADIGVALGSGSDLTKEVADIVLLDDNLATISVAVYEGRVMFDNIRKILTYLLIDSFSEIVLISSAIFLGLPSPLNALQILWINLVSDGFPYLALTVEPGEPAIMQEKPRPQEEPIINNEMKALIFGIGIITDIGLLILYILVRQLGYPLIHCQTVVFTAFAIDSLLYVFSIRSMRTSIFHSNPLSNKWMLPAVMGGVLLQLMVLYIPYLQSLFRVIPLRPIDWGFVLLFSFIKIIAIELTKAWFINRRIKS